MKITPKGIFKFTSQTPGSKEEYNVNLSLPSCNCFDFHRTVWPCKHILAIFYHFNSWSWENLPKSYTNSPFISIDNDIVATKIKYSQHPNNSNTQFKNSSHEIQQDEEDIRAGDDEDEDNENINVQLKSLPPRHRKNDIQKEQEQCRILLKEAIDLTYNCNNESILKECINLCHNITDKLSEAVDKVDGLLLSNNIPDCLPSSKKKKKRKLPPVAGNLKDLPPYKKPKKAHWKGRNRVGMKADIFKKYFNCKVDVSKKDIIKGTYYNFFCQ